MVYGDSLSDNGNLFAASGQPGRRISMAGARNGPVALEQLSGLLGSALVDFAWIGATTGIGSYADAGTTTTTGSSSLPGMQVEFADTKALLGQYLSSGCSSCGEEPMIFQRPRRSTPRPGR